MKEPIQIEMRLLRIDSHNIEEIINIPFNEWNGFFAVQGRECHHANGRQ